MDAGLEFFILMGVILKIPVLAACWLIWHAVRAEPEPAETAGEDDGNQRSHFRRQPQRPPRNPRRGPHAPDSLPIPCPEDEGETRLTRSPGRVREHQA